VVEPRESAVRSAASRDHRVHLAAYALRRDVEAIGLALDPTGVPPPGVLVLQNHGALAVGANMEEAICRLEIAEHLAASLLLAEAKRP